MVKETVILYGKEFRKMRKSETFVSFIDLKVMKTLLTARLPVTVSSMQMWFYVCKTFFARKHTATHKPTSAQPLIVTTMTHNNRLWSP